MSVAKSCNPFCGHSLIASPGVENQSLVSQVGLPGVSGLSVEQRKRLTIAVELVANPSIIFMDEPTSGLDARAAAIVMRAVRNIVNTGRTIVCTIHQPSIDIFESFDELLLLRVAFLTQNWFSSGSLIYSKRACYLWETFPIYGRSPPAVWQILIASLKAVCEESLRIMTETIRGLERQPNTSL